MSEESAARVMRPDRRTFSSLPPCVNGKTDVFLHCARDFRDKNLGQNSFWNSAACCLFSHTKLNQSMCAWAQYARYLCCESIKLSTVVTISKDLRVFSRFGVV